MENNYVSELETPRRRLSVETIGKGYNDEIAPAFEWRQRMLNARHSPIRFLQFSFLMRNIPSNTATHFVRHVHAQPYVSSLRNDRQKKIDGDKAPRNSPVGMIIDMNAEELMVMANKRLCTQAAPMTRKVMQMIKKVVVKERPEFEPFLVPMCEYHGGVCHEMYPCELAEVRGK